MRRRAANAGMTLVELLVGMGLGLVGAAAMTALVRGGIAAGARASTDAETAIEAAAALDQLVRDLRVAGYDPTGAGITALPVVAADRIELQADLDGDGAIDPTSEEQIGYRVAPSSRSLQRVVGAQSLPILSNVATDSFRLAYFTADGTRLDPADAATGAATRVVQIDLTTAPPGRPSAVRLLGGARLVNR